MKLSKKRLLVAASGITAIGAAGALLAGVTFGLFSSQAVSGSSTFSSGTVSVSDDASSAPCTVTNLVPGESSAVQTATQDQPCTFVVDNSSTVPVYAAVDVFIATGKATSVGSTYGNTSPVTPKDLYDGSNTTGLNVSISDGTSSYTVPVTANKLASCTLASTDPFFADSSALSSPSADSCYEIQDLLLSTSAVPTATTTIATLTTSWNLPSLATNAYQGADALIAFNAHAVQSQYNALPAGCTTAGAACPASGTFKWS